MKGATEVGSGAIHHPPAMSQCPGREQRNALGKCSVNVSVQNIRYDKEEAYRDDRTRRQIYWDLVLRVSPHFPWELKFGSYIHRPDKTGTGKVDLPIFRARG